MNANEIVAIWLHDYSARLFLGLHGDRPVSRWVVMGTVMGIRRRSACGLTSITSRNAVVAKKTQRCSGR